MKIEKILLVSSLPLSNYLVMKLRDILKKLLVSDSALCLTYVFAI